MKDKVFLYIVSLYKQFRISPHRPNVILGIEKCVKKDCFHNAPWSITTKLHAVCEQNWVQIERIKKIPKIIHKAFYGQNSLMVGCI